jgi:hypothetical protein
MSLWLPFSAASSKQIQHISLSASAACKDEMGSAAYKTVHGTLGRSYDPQPAQGALRCLLTILLAAKWPLSPL